MLATSPIFKESRTLKVELRHLFTINCQFMYKVFTQRNFTPKFYGLSVKLVNVKWVGNFFYRSSLFCFFREKLSFE